MTSYAIVRKGYIWDIKKAKWIKNNNSPCTRNLDRFTDRRFFLSHKRAFKYFRTNQDFILVMGTNVNRVDWKFRRVYHHGTNQFDKSR